MRASLPAAALAVCVSGCVSLFDVMGVEEFVTEKSAAEGNPDPIADDRIEDKHPVFDESLTIDETFGPCVVTLNKSGSITKLDIAPFDAGKESIGDQLFRSYADAALKLDLPWMPSMEVVQGMLKPFNDGLYAAVELAAQSGSQGAGINKAQLFKDLLAALVDRSSNGTPDEKPLAADAASLFAAALQASGETVTVPPAIASGASSLLDALNADSSSSQPIGFYTWNPLLEGIFRQDRMLQCRSQCPAFGAFAATASLLNSNADLSSRFGGVLDLYAGMTNPFADWSPRDVQPLVPTPDSLSGVDGIKQQFKATHPLDGDCDPRMAMVPASDAPENKLFKALFCPIGPDEGQDLIDVLISRIRSGSIDLTPTDQSGWYDRQLYALETLLVPERAAEKDHLFLTKRYKEKLVETFKTIITQNRETHAKQVKTESSGTNSAEIVPTPFDVYPLLPVEPFPTFYLRTARAYAFLDTMLQATMGKEFLAQAHRPVESGAAITTSLGDELADRTCLLYGMSIVSGASLGMRPLLTAEEQQAYPVAKCDARARDWLAAWDKDRDVESDQRVIVPVFNDWYNNQIRYWAVIGVKAIRVQA
ncbi:MAG: hypothetical protein HY898_05565 [Deltaproteobacteria bacterium]|nr:hypothetical protein [Deltaproteobacteria bacterium]